jgi:hypothetical protein
MQTSTVSESIPITILTLPESWTKAITDEYPQYCGRNLDAKPSTNGVLAKTVKLVL